MWLIFILLLVVILLLICKKKGASGGYDKKIVDYTLSILKGGTDYDSFYDNRKGKDPYVKENQIGKILKTDDNFFELCKVLTKYYPRDKVLEQLGKYKNDKSFFKNLGNPKKVDYSNKYIGNDFVYHTNVYDLKEIDLTPKYLNIGPKKAGEIIAKKLGIKLHNVEDFDKLKFDDNTFTLITCIHSFKNDPNFIAEIRRCLKPDGILFVEDYDAKDGITRMIIEIDQKLSGKKHRETYSWEEMIPVLADAFGEAKSHPGTFAVARNLKEDK